jgi:ABC-type branched-subunit amino acid transport system permease subunit
MNALILSAALFALVGISYAVYQTITHDHKAKHDH